MHNYAVTIFLTRTAFTGNFLKTRPSFGKSRLKVQWQVIIIQYIAILSRGARGAKTPAGSDLWGQTSFAAKK
jgi:hypothetical protein